MLEQVHVGMASIDCYEKSCGSEAIAKLRALAAPLRGVRVLQINATPYGGGVAELLFSEIPLLRDLGLEPEWHIIAGNTEFFEVTKRIHNGLQGNPTGLSAADRDLFCAHSKQIAQLFDQENYDVIVVHDPQPAALPYFHGKDGAKWIWRCHIDTAQPNPEVWSFLKPYVAEYDAAIVTMQKFVPPDFPIKHVEIIPPAIDPISPKNLQLDTKLAGRLLQWIGVELDKPLITQISRFDPWKDPMGVIAAYRLVKHEVPEAQLALVGSMALDDPEGWEIYRQVQEAGKTDSGIHVFTNLNGVGNVEVNAFQRLSKVVVQKSLREGFGLVVSETLWKGTPVVAGRAGGIPLQLHDREGGFLVHSVEECAERIIWLLRHPAEARAMGERGRAQVRERFLLPRLLADELRVYTHLLNLSSPTPAPDKAPA